MKQAEVRFKRVLVINNNAKTISLGRGIYFCLLFPIDLFFKFTFAEYVIKVLTITCPKGILARSVYSM